MAKIGVFTIASKNYLPYVRALLASVSKIHPEYRRFLCLADDVNGFFDVEAETYEIVLSEQIGIPFFQDMVLRYDIMEFNTAIKPFMFKWLFENTDLDIIIYLDPDICVYSRFDRLERVIYEGASVVLIPHITKPVEDGKNPNDYHMLQSGVFNLGFIAARRCTESLDYINWWGRRLATQCTADFSKNLFTDQKWCDLAPCFLDNLRVFKDPGYNVAYWNLVQREIIPDSGGGWLVNGEPLVFFHFSGLNSENRHVVSKHQNRLAWEEITTYQCLFESYHEILNECGWKVSRQWPYVYDRILPEFMNLPTLVRQLYKQVNSAPINHESKNIGEYLIDLCNQPTDKISADNYQGITRLMALVYQSRPDLQAAFSFENAEGRMRFSKWFEIAGEREYGLPPAVTCPSMISGSSSAIAFKKKL
jgi:hypothetical protein